MLGDAIRTRIDPLALMRRIAQEAMSLVASADGVVIELSDGRGNLVYVAAGGTLAAHAGLQLPVEGSLSGRSMRTRATLRCDDSETDSRVDRDACRRVGVRSMICVPLVTAHRSVGVLKVSSGRAAAFGPADEEVLAVLAEFVSTVVDASSELARVTLEFLSVHRDGPPPIATSASGFVANVLEPGLSDSVEHHRHIDHALAIGISTVVQPIVDLGTGALVGAEALSRLPADPTRSPVDWFVEAHLVGRGVELELAAAEAAVAQLDHLPDGCHLAVNVGPEALQHERLGEIVAAHAGRLVLELTEHDRVIDYDGMCQVVGALRELGARFAIDDTGAGFASLSHIVRLRPDIVKIDRDLVDGIERDPARSAMVASLVRLAADLDAVVVAEGIETQAQQDAVSDLGVPLGQGYWIARPGDAADLRSTYAPSDRTPDRAVGSS